MCAQEPKFKTVVTIDGPAGAGKSTVARELAKKLGFVHLNSGALFRAVAHEAHRQGISFEDGTSLAQLANKMQFSFHVGDRGLTRLRVNGNEIDEAVHSQMVGEFASRIAVHRDLRDVLTEVQRGVARAQAVVVEGRDAGTVVFPETMFKFFLDATVEVRAKRRFEELRVSEKSISDVRTELETRDHRDSTRSIAPQKAAEDAVVIDTTNLNVSEVVEKICSLMQAVARGE